MNLLSSRGKAFHPNTQKKYLMRHNEIKKLFYLPYLIAKIKCVSLLPVTYTLYITHSLKKSNFWGHLTILKVFHPVSVILNLDQVR